MYSKLIFIPKGAGYIIYVRGVATLRHVANGTSHIKAELKYDEYLPDMRKWLHPTMRVVTITLNLNLNLAYKSLPKKHVFYSETPLAVFSNGVLLG